MKHKPELGNVLRIENKDFLLCVESFLIKDDDTTLRGDSVFADVFVVIKLEDVDKVNPETVTYQLPGGSMVVGKEIPLDKIEFITHVKVKKQQTVIYHVED